MTSDRGWPALPPPSRGERAGIYTVLAAGIFIPRRLTARSYLRGVCALCAIILAVGLTLAPASSSSLAYLGRPTNAAPENLPLASYRHTGPFLRLGGKPELLFIGSMVDTQSASERWPIVKALGQFGSWSGLRPAETRDCLVEKAGGPIVCRERVPGTVQDPALQSDGHEELLKLPTYDFSHARYTSRYVAFVAKDLVDANLQVHQDLNGEELRLFNEYLRPPGARTWRDAAWLAASGVGDLEATGRHYPLVSVGGYLQTEAPTANLGDLEDTKDASGYQNIPLPQPFSTIQESLQRGKAVDYAEPSLVYDFNVEANIITALVCHADAGKPSSVCDRPVIRQIDRHVK